MNRYRFNTFAKACAFMLVLLTGAVGAATMQYSFTGVGTGTLDATAFEQNPFTIIGRADPANIADCGLDCRYVDFASAEVSLAGLGSFTILSPTRVFNNRGNLGLSRGGADGADLIDAFLVPQLYDFASPLGPVNGLVAFLQWQGDGADDVLTSGGVLVFNDGDTDGSFTVQGVPLPGGVWMLGSALGACTLIRRRRA